MESTKEEKDTYIHNLSVFYCLDDKDDMDSIWLLLLLVIIFNILGSEEEECTEVITDKICNK